MIVGPGDELVFEFVGNVGPAPYELPLTVFVALFVAATTAVKNELYVLFNSATWEGTAFGSLLSFCD